MENMERLPKAGGKTWGYIVDNYSHGSHHFPRYEQWQKFAGEIYRTEKEARGNAFGYDEVLLVEVSSDKTEIQVRFEQNRTWIRSSLGNTGSSSKCCPVCTPAYF